MEKELVFSDWSKHDDDTVATSTITAITTVDLVRPLKMFKIESKDKKQDAGDSNCGRVLQKLPLEVISTIVSFATIEEWLKWLRISSLLHKVGSRTTSLPYRWKLRSDNAEQLNTRKVCSLIIGQSASSLDNLRQELEMISRQTQLEELFLIFSEPKILQAAKLHDTLPQYLPRSLRKLHISGGTRTNRGTYPEFKLDLSGSNGFTNLTELAVSNLNIWDYNLLPPSLTNWIMLSNFNGADEKPKKMASAIEVVSTLPLREFVYLGQMLITEEDLLFLSRCAPKLEKLDCELPTKASPPPSATTAAMFPHLTSLYTSARILDSLERFLSANTGLLSLFLSDGNEKASFSFRFLKQLPRLTKLQLYNEHNGKLTDLAALTTATTLTELRLHHPIAAAEDDEKDGSGTQAQAKFLRALPPSLTSLHHECFKSTTLLSEVVLPQVRKLSLHNSSERYQHLDLKWFLDRFPELRELELTDHQTEGWCRSWIKTHCNSGNGCNSNNDNNGNSDSSDSVDTSALIARNKIEVIKVQLADLLLTEFRNLVKEILATYPKLRWLQLGGELGRFRTVPDEVFALANTRGVNIVY